MRPLGLAGLSGLATFGTHDERMHGKSFKIKRLSYYGVYGKSACGVCVRRFLEPVAVSEADAVQALVVFLGIGVRGVLEIDRQIVVLVEVVADLDRNVKQHA